MFHAAGILLRCFRVNSRAYQPLRKKLMPLIDFFCDFQTRTCQMEKSILIHCQKASIP